MAGPSACVSRYLGCHLPWLVWVLAGQETLELDSAESQAVEPVLPMDRLAAARGEVLSNHIPMVADEMAAVLETGSLVVSCPLPACLQG